MPRPGAVRAVPNPSAGPHASRDSRARTAVTLAQTQTSLRHVALAPHRIAVPNTRPRNDEAPVGSCRPGPRERSPEGQLHEPTLPERVGLARHFIQARKRDAFAHARPHGLMARGRVYGVCRFDLDVHRGAHSTLTDSRVERKFTVNCRAWTHRLGLRWSTPRCGSRIRGIPSSPPRPWSASRASRMGRARTADLRACAQSVIHHATNSSNSIAPS